MRGDTELYIIVGLISLIAGFVPGIALGIYLTRGHIGGGQQRAMPPFPRRTRVLRDRPSRYEEDDYYR